MLGWELMQNRRTMRKLSLLHQTLQTKSPNYLYQISAAQTFGSVRVSDRLELVNIPSKTTKFKKSFFPATIIGWNKLDFVIRASNSKNILKKRVLNKIDQKKLHILAFEIMTKLGI